MTDVRLPTEIRLAWVNPPVVLSIKHANRALNCDELRAVVDVVESIEQFRDEVRGTA